MEAKRFGGGRYRVVRKLGAGGMGTVFLAQDERLERAVALKRMHSDLDPEIPERFRREARLGASLNHPNVVRVFDVFEESDEEVTTLVLEYVDGENLAQALRRGALAPRRALEVLGPLADALDHAHENGVVHRDVKPANVLLAKDGTVKLADLGVATGVDVTRVTSSGAAVGSAPYMAPEQLAGDQVTAAVDIYGLAVVAFEALTGRRARTGDSPMAIVHQVANHPAPELMEAWPEAPPAASAVLLRGMADRPEERPESAVAMVADLRTALGPVLRADAAAPGPVETPTPAPEPEPPTPEPEPPTPEPEPPTPAPPAPTPASPAPAPPAAEAPAPRPSAPVARSPRRRRPARALFALLGALAAAAVVAAIVLSGGEEKPAAQKPADPAPAQRTPSPASVVRSFYSEAAADRFEDAWKLAGPGVREQLGGFDAFKRQLGTLRSVDFQENRVQSTSGRRATVAIQTRAVHTDRVDNCRGDVTLVKQGTGWLIDRLGVTCG